MTITQTISLIQRVENTDFSQLDFTKLPSDFKTVNDFEKYVVKVLNGAKSDINNALKIYNAELQAAKMKELLAPWLAKFDGDPDMAYAAIKAKLNATETVNNTIENTEPDVAPQPNYHAPQSDHSVHAEPY